MCVLAVIIGENGALTVAANRDESRSRPSAPPQVLDAARGIVGGRDLKSGGTWLGLNGEGLFVAVTNRREPASKAESFSRGQLALEALRCGKLG
jgi:uncharacterized protein with NRDE domain